MATAAELKVQYDRAKAKLDAERANALKTASENLALQKRLASENLAMQTKQIGELTAEQKLNATKQASQAFVNAKQSERVLPAQMAQSGLSQSGYQSLAKQKMAQDLTKNRQSIQGDLSSNLAGLNRQQAGYTQAYNQGLLSDNQSYNQSVRNTNLSYNQNLADLNLEKTQTEQAQKAYDSLVASANRGELTYDQYKKRLIDMGTDSVTQSALLQAYLRYAEARNRAGNGR